MKTIIMKARSAGLSTLMSYRGVTGTKGVVGIDSQIKNGYMTCNNCLGNGYGYIGLCIVCNGDGKRKPNWTEYIIYKSELIDCDYNRETEG